jgi:hypothetical protein
MTGSFCRPPRLAAFPREQRSIRLRRLNRTDNGDGSEIKLVAQQGSAHASLVRPNECQNSEPIPLRDAERKAHPIIFIRIGLKRRQADPVEPLAPRLLLSFSGRRQERHVAASGNSSRERRVARYSLCRTSEPRSCPHRGRSFVGFPVNEPQMRSASIRQPRIAELRRCQMRQNRSFYQPEDVCRTRR